MKTNDFLIAGILSLTVFSFTGRPLFAAALGASPEKQDAATEGKIAPDTGTLPPAPELTPEERERLLNGTERTAPCNKKDGHRSTDDSSKPGSTPSKK